MIGALAFALLAQAPDPAAAARSEEEAAFGAIDRKEWCTAMHHFLAADRHAPSVDFLLNAAMAAEYADDRAAARAHAALAVERGGPRVKEARERARALEAALKKLGPGNACPAPVEPPPAPAEPAQLAPATTPTAAPDDGASGAGPPLVPIAVLGVGGVVALAGGVALAVGAVPWFQHGAAVASLREAEASAADDAQQLATLQREQTDARAAWEGYGQILVLGGAIASGVGVVAAIVGGALFVVEAE